MKRKILPLMIAGISAAYAGVAAADVTIYGKGNVSLNSVDLESNGDDQFELTSNASRVGVKGSYDINDSGLKAIFKMEYEVFIDDGDDGKGSNSEFKQRNIYAGFQGNFGTFFAGNHDTPMKMAQGKVDRFNDLQEGDIKNVLWGEVRGKNVLVYVTPNMSGFSAAIALQPGEQNETEGNNDGIADATSISLSYKNDNLRVALANDSEIGGIDLTRVVAEYKMGDAKVGVLFQTGEEAEGTDEQDAYVVSGEYKIDKVVLKAQYAYSETDDGTANDEEKTQTAIGADYKLNKKSKLYTYFSNVETEQGSASEDDQVFAVGYEIKF